MFLREAQITCQKMRPHHAILAVPHDADFDEQSSLPQFIRTSTQKLSWHLSYKKLVGQHVFQ
jgi:hypothetical protein